MYIDNNIFYRIMIAMLMLIFYACEDYVEIDPSNTLIVSEEVFKNEKMAKSAVDGIYQQLAGINSFAGGAQNSVTLMGGLSADAFLAGPYFSGLGDFALNNLYPGNSNNYNLWDSLYNTIYAVNAAYEGLGASPVLEEGLRKQLLGEVLFIRAFCYFYLVNLYGDVPLILSTDYKMNALVGRSSMDAVYNQILTDCKEAGGYLNNEYRTEERIYCNQYVLKAFLARVHLFLSEWEKADELATKVINAGLYQLEPNLDEVFLKNSREAIWQLKPTFGYTNEGDTFILTGSPISGYLNPVYLRDGFVNGFEEGDERQGSWLGSYVGSEGTFYYPFKYKVSFSTGAATEYSMVIRLAELFLVRAEARLRLGDVNGAVNDLNVIRQRAGLEPVTNTQEGLSSAIGQERRMELFSEWGHRWLDLKRWGLASDTLGALKADWQDTDVLYPIPEQELLRNPNLTQNDGY